MNTQKTCPKCGTPANLEEQSLGRRGRCTKCGHVSGLVFTKPVSSEKTHPTQFTFGGLNHGKFAGLLTRPKIVIAGIVGTVLLLGLIVFLAFGSRPQAAVEKDGTIAEKTTPQSISTISSLPDQPQVNLGWFHVYSGEWTLVGDELHQVNAERRWTGLAFGDPRWTDYDYSVDLMRTAGGDCCRLMSRLPDSNSFFSFNFSSWVHYASGTSSGLYSKTQGTNWAALQETSFVIDDNRWYTARVSVRGSHILCTLHDDQNNKMLEFDASSENHPTGCVGLGTWGSVYRYKNIKVTSPDGQELWNGLPALGPGISGPGSGMDLEAIR